MTSNFEGVGGHPKWRCSRCPNRFNSTVYWIKRGGALHIIKLKFNPIELDFLNMSRIKKKYFKYLYTKNIIVWAREWKRGFKDLKHEFLVDICISRCTNLSFSVRSYTLAGSRTHSSLKRNFDLLKEVNLAFLLIKKNLKTIVFKRISQAEQEKAFLNPLRMKNLISSTKLVFFI